MHNNKSFNLFVLLYVVGFDYFIIKIFYKHSFYSVCMWICFNLKTAFTDSIRAIYGIPQLIE